MHRACLQKAPGLWWTSGWPVSTDACVRGALTSAMPRRDKVLEASVSTHRREGKRWALQHDKGLPWKASLRRERSQITNSWPFTLWPWDAGTVTPRRSYQEAVLWRELTWHLWPPAGRPGGRQGRVADEKDQTELLDSISGCGSAFSQLRTWARDFASVDLFPL